jgi:hypothetical protein
MVTGQDVEQLTLGTTTGDQPETQLRIAVPKMFLKSQW